MVKIHGKKHSVKRHSVRKHKTLRARKSKTYRRRHTRKHRGGRGGMGGAELGHAYTTGASQTLYQLTGRTPGLSS